MERLKQLVEELEPQLVNPLSPQMRKILHEIMEIVRRLPDAQ